MANEQDGSPVILSAVICRCPTMRPLATYLTIESCLENSFPDVGCPLIAWQRALILADAGSLARAADGDPNRQSQYSRQIKELEAFFGVELTRRRGQTLELTDAGRRVVDICRETFSRLDDFQNDCDARPTTVVIGSGDSLFQWLLLPRLGSARRLFPNHTVRLEDLPTDDVVARLGDMRIDLGITRLCTGAAIGIEAHSTAKCRDHPCGRCRTGGNCQFDIGAFRQGAAR